jgi:hypothetical protein
MAWLDPKEIQVLMDLVAEHDLDRYKARADKIREEYALLMVAEGREVEQEMKLELAGMVEEIESEGVEIVPEQEVEHEMGPTTEPASLYDGFLAEPPHEHAFTLSESCGAHVCGCGLHAHLNRVTGAIIQELARCYCGWNLSPGERLEDDVDAD